MKAAKPGLAKEQREKMCYNAMNIGATQYHQAAYILELILELEVEEMLPSRRLAEIVADYPGLQLRLARLVRGHISQKEDALTQHVLATIKMGNLSFIHPVLEGLVGQLERLLAHAPKDTKLAKPVDLTRVLVKYGLLSKPLAGTLRRSPELEHSNLSIMIDAQLTPNQLPAALSEVTEANLRFWLAYPRATINERFFEAVDKIKGLHRHAFLELIPCV